MVKIFPSLISADLLHLGMVISDLESYSDGWHVDIMDNHFVPNLTWGPMFANAISAISTRQMWVHLMVDNPLSIIDRLRIPGRSIITFHIETNSDIFELKSKIRENNWLVGLAISPKTPVDKLFAVLDVQVAHVTIMSVVPGFSGQEFMMESMTTLEKVVEFRKEKKLDFVIAMDGGINKKNLPLLATNGVDHVAVASAIFDSESPAQALAELRPA